MTAICPYCNSEIPNTAPDPCYCTACGTAHHTECWEENGGCTVFGCSAAPPEEPKLTVEAADFSAVPSAPPPPPPSQVSTPPPPRPQRISFSFGGYVPPAASGYVPPAPTLAPAKSRVSYILLGIFLGAFGAHNFYAGYVSRGVAQLAITLCTLFFGAVISWIWAIVEVCTVDRDSRNVYMV